MTDMSRRRFIESAGLAAALPALAGRPGHRAGAVPHGRPERDDARARLERRGARGHVPPLLQHRPLGT